MVHRLSITPIRSLLFPLPEGEGQGGVRVRGKFSVEHEKCSVSQGLLSRRRAEDSQGIQQVGRAFPPVACSGVLHNTS